MFPRQKKRQDRNNRNPGNILNNEKEAGGISGNIGNEALNQVLDIALNESNEANNEALGKEIPKEIIREGLEGYYQNDLNNDKLNKRGIPKNIRRDGLTDYYQNDLHNLEWKKTRKAGRRRKSEDIIPLIPVEDEAPKFTEDIIKNADGPKKGVPGE